MKNETTKKDRVSDKMNSLVRLLDMKPQLAKPQHGPEPSLRELLVAYAELHGIIFPESYANDYMNELKTMQANTKITCA